MERDVVLTGIGGQGIQLVGNLLAKAAVKDGKYVSMLGVYGGKMRGGPSGSTLIIGDGPVRSPPKVSTAWSIIEFHPKYWCQVELQPKPGTIVLYNSNLSQNEHENATYQLVPVAATKIGRSIGNEMLGAMAMLGAYVRTTGIVQLDSVKHVMTEAIPKYRHDRISANLLALDAGYDAANPLEVAA